MTDKIHQRGLQTVDNAELVDADPEEIAKVLIDINFSTLIEWSEALKETTPGNKQNADILIHINNEIMRHTLKMSGGIPG